MRIFLLLTLCIALSTPAAAQRSGEAYVTQASTALGTSVPDLLGDDVTSSPGPVERFLASPLGFGGLNAIGLTNSIVLEQQGDGNGVRIEQDGLRNSAVIAEVGNGNFVSLLQSGNDNLYGVALMGDDNQTIAQQLGDDNSYSLVFVGSSLRHNVLQQGIGNQAIQVGTSSTRPADIVQRGNGLQLLIEHN